MDNQTQAKIQTQAKYEDVNSENESIRIHITNRRKDANIKINDRNEQNLIDCSKINETSKNRNYINKNLENNVNIHKKLDINEDKSSNKGINKKITRKKKQNKNNLVIMLLNIRSIKNKLNELEIFLEELNKKPSIIIITESWLKK